MEKSNPTYKNCSNKQDKSDLSNCKNKQENQGAQNKKNNPQPTNKCSNKETY